MSVSILLVMSAARTAVAGATIKVDDTRSLTIALAMRSSLASTERGAPDGKRRSWDPLLENAVLAVGGELERRIKVQLNSARGIDGGVRVLDGILMLEPSQAWKIWGGRLLPPGDRATLSGPFFGALWEPPFTSVYPAAFAGRDDGAALWGNFAAGRLKYMAGGFRGRDGGTNSGDDPLVAGRVVLQLLEAEPGYYNAGTYHGAKRILALGAAARAQRHGVGTPPDPVTGAPGDRGDFLGWNVDLLAEQPIGKAGTGTLEAAFYRYDLGGAADPLLVQGDGWYVVGAWLLPLQIGPARLQPAARWQALDTDAGPLRTRWDACLNVLLNGQFTRIGIQLSGEDKRLGTGEVRTVKLGAQLIL